jgi:hypothetical protein
MFDLITVNRSLNSTPIILKNDSELLLPFIAFPILSIFGLLSNMINIIVFVHPKMKDISFKYLLAISISHLFYCAFSIYSNVLYCEACLCNKTYSSQFYKLLVNYYFTNCLAIFGHLCELFISMHRYLQLKNLKYLDRIPVKLNIFILFIFSFFIYMREILAYNILQTQIFLNGTLIDVAYSLTNTEFGNTSAANIIPIVIALIKIFISTVLIAVINIGIVYEFHKRFNKRIQLKKKYKAALSNFIN